MLEEKLSSEAGQDEMSGKTREASSKARGRRSTGCWCEHLLQQRDSAAADTQGKGGLGVAMLVEAERRRSFQATLQQRAHYKLPRSDLQ